MRCSLLALLLVAAATMADGKFYYRDEIPADGAYQRALIVHDGQRETLLVQPKLRNGDDDVGWVVPVPALPQLVEVDPVEASDLFRSFTYTTRPGEHSIGLIYLLLVTSLTILALALKTVRALASPVRGRATVADDSPGARWRRPLLLLAAVVLPLVALEASGTLAWVPLLLAGFAAYALFMVRAGAPGLLLLVILVLLAFVAIPSYQDLGVTVHAEHEIGPYDVAVVSAETPAPMLAWLAERRFRFTAADEDTLGHYTDDGWYFVAARIRPGATSAAGADSPLLPPLGLRFDAERPVYPMKLTGVGGVDTEVDLYVLAPWPMRADGRLELTYASERAFELRGLARTLAPDGLGSPVRLTKLEGRLAPADMRTDIFLSAVPEAAGYRRSPYRFGDFRATRLHDGRWRIGEH